MSPIREFNWISVLKIVAGCIVCGFVVSALRSGIARLEQESIVWSDIDPAWALVSAGAYLGGMLMMGIFWHRVLHAMGERLGWGETLQAFFVGHLGKYVPGKATVVLLRMSFLKRDGVNLGRVAVSVFVETLTMMAVGAGIAAAYLLSRGTQHVGLLGLACGLVVIAGLPTLPPVMRFLASWTRRRGGAAAKSASVEGIDFRLIGVGWLLNLVGWTLLGVSYWAAIRSLPLPNNILPWDELPRLIASVGLSVVAGFLFFLVPGGIGVRELVLGELMTESVGKGTAIVSAVWLRLIWLFAEMTVSSIIMSARRWSQRMSADRRRATTSPQSPP